MVERSTSSACSSSGKVRSSRESGQYFADLNHIAGAPATNETKVADGVRVEQVLWRNDSKVEVELVAIHGGGHGIPQPYRRHPRLLGPSPKEPNGPDVIWAFFERQRPLPHAAEEGPPVAPRRTAPPSPFPPPPTMGVGARGPAVRFPSPEKGGTGTLKGSTSRVRRLLPPPPPPIGGPVGGLRAARNAGFFVAWGNVRAPSWVQGRVALVGDAAAVLADELSRTDAAHLSNALDLYVKRRRRRVEGPEPIALAGARGVHSLPTARLPEGSHSAPHQHEQMIGPLIKQLTEPI